MIRRTSTFRHGIPLLLAAAALLAGCEHNRAGVQPASAPPTANAQAPASQPAPQAAPEAPVTVQQASAACWMKFERGRGGLSLDARAKLVDRCIDERMKAASAR